MPRLLLLVALLFILVDQIKTQDERSLPAFASTRFLTVDCIQRQTTWREDITGHLVYLRQHSLYCPYPRAMRNVRLQRRFVGWKREIRYSYRCCKPHRSVFYHNRKTSLRSYGNGKVYNLRFHTVSCGSQSLLAGFRLVRSGTKVQYRYYCRKMGSMKCYSRFTPYMSYGSGWNSALSYHSLRCSSFKKEFLAGFRLRWNSTTEKIRYWYRCCRQKSGVLVPPITT